jgi:hypothetical protein
MSMHKTQLTELERTGLVAHGLACDAPSQLSDAFRLGIAWAQNSVPQSVQSETVAWMYPNDLKHMLEKEASCAGHERTVNGQEATWFKQSLRSSHDL